MWWVYSTNLLKFIAQFAGRRIFEIGKHSAKYRQEVCLMRPAHPGSVLLKHEELARDLM